MSIEISSNEMAEQVPCNLCGSREQKVIIEPATDREDEPSPLSASGGIRGSQRIVKCRDCELVYVSPRPNADSIVDSYATTPDELYVSQFETRLNTFRRTIKFLHRFNKPPGRLLDIGTAAGTFLKAAEESGWEAVGIEPSTWMAQWGRDNLGVNIKTGTLKEANFPDNTFDAVTMWDVLEHVPDPRSELEETWRILKPDGILLVNFPDFGDPLARLAGRHWWFLLSVHIFYFTKKTLHRMLRTAGFQTVTDRPYIQVLEFGHLMKMVGLYNQTVSRAGVKLLNILRMSRIPVPYYASQTLTIARKEKMDG
ncbi:MAG: class I SAM-dependent methyltransferase [bacterium]|nr:class I SAM-dependent methyltransferase [bacterium]